MTIDVAWCLVMLNDTLWCIHLTISQLDNAMAGKIANWLILQMASLPVAVGKNSNLNNKAETLTFQLLMIDWSRLQLKSEMYSKPEQSLAEAGVPKSHQNIYIFICYRHRRFTSLWDVITRKTKYCHQITRTGHI